MYMTLRTSHAAPGKSFELLELAGRLVPMINERHGSSLAAAIQVGGNPEVLGVSSAWESIAAFEAFRAAAMADEEISALMAQASALTNYTEDQLAQVLKAPGERAGYTEVFTAQAQVPRIAEAIPFGLEAAEMVEAKTGVTVGFATSVTGTIGQVGWFSRHASLAALVTMNETLNADTEFMELYKRSADLMVDGSASRAIWQTVG